MGISVAILKTILPCGEKSRQPGLENRRTFPTLQRSRKEERFPMRYAVIAPDSETRLLIAAASRAGDLICSVFSGGSDSPPESNGINQPLEEISPAIGGNLPLDRWEELLHEPRAEFVILGRHRASPQELPHEDVADKLRRLVQASLRIVSVFPGCQALTGFECQMIQQDTHSIVMPYFRGLYAPVCDFLAHWGEEEHPDLGNLQHIAIQRYALQTTHADLVHLFARDATLLRRVLGKIDRLSAMRPPENTGSQAKTWAGVSIQMSDPQGRVVQWTLWPDRGRGIGEKTAEFIFQGSKGRLVAECSRESPFVLDVKDPGIVNLSQPGLGEVPLSLQALDDLEYQRICAGLANEGLAASYWEHACRAMELAETIEISARRGKTIPLFHEEHSELSTFKSMMAASGCLSLLGILAMIPFIALLDRLFPNIAASPTLKNLPWLFLAVLLAAFLGLQGIVWLTSTDEPKDRT